MTRIYVILTIAGWVWAVVVFALLLWKRAKKADDAKQ